MRARAKAATATTTGTAQQQLSVPKLEANNSQSNSYTLTPNYTKDAIIDGTIDPMWKDGFQTYHKHDLEYID